MTNIAINGFGRIGRLFYRQMADKKFKDSMIATDLINDVIV